MKKLLFLLFTLVFLPPSVNSQNTTPTFNAPLPKISAKGKVKLPDGRTIKIKGFNSAESTVFFIVRHAEKDSAGNLADLVPVGRARANTYPIIFKDIDIKGVYSTDRPRTRHTAEPIAVAKSKTVELYDAKTQADLLKTLVEQRGNRFFIVGHSNTVPQIVNILMGNDTEKEFSEKDYSRLYIVVAEKIGKARMHLINF
jgi:2,3-bisphosphoglycerate-dependent phosphoglycerate mutase